MIYINKLRKNWHVCLLISIAFFSHWYLFFDPNILTTGDWAFYYNSQAHTLSNFNIYLSSFNLGTIMPTPTNWVFLSLFSLLTKIHISWNVFERIFFLIPIIFFTPLSSFFLLKKITNNKLIAFYASCLYSFNTFFLRLQMDWLTYAFIWWILPLLLLCVIEYLDNNDNIYLLSISFLTFIGIVSEIRIAILVLSFLSIFSLHNIFVFSFSY